MLFLPFFNYKHITPHITHSKACTTTTNVDRTPLTNLNGRLKCVPSIKVTSSDKTGSSFFARDLHSTSTNSNSISGDVGYDFSLLSEATSDTTLDSFGHDLDQNGRSTSHSNVLQGDLELSLLSRTTSDITLDSFGHDLDQNGRSTSNSNNLGGDLQLSLLSATTGDTTVNSYGHDFDKNGFFLRFYGLRKKDFGYDSKKYQLFATNHKRGRY
ncbi:uncharacterized protein LOC123470683 [Daphnia magna]|uniref:uncharacterized protein LOC123470683 n=1 Tax=Daphnia magna TaxID=35525 RepID=UPI001E1BC7F4|nr:uncharacterized protein LOC123470683 [Daphnia magna]